MITIKSTRQRGTESFDLSKRQVSVSSALESLCRYELAFGGQLIDANKTCLKIKTIVFNCIDETTFTGSENEMQTLIDATFAHYELTKRNIDTIIKNTIQNSHGLPLFITASGPVPNDILSGMSFSKIAAITAVTLDENDVLLIDKILKAYPKDEDLYAFLDLWMSNKKDALCLLQQEIMK